MSVLTAPVQVPAYLAPYREMLRATGHGRFESLLWTSRHTQAARFQAITEMTDLAGRSVLDAGCGHADFLRHLNAAGIAYARYVGIEALDEHLSIARAVGLPRAEIVAADFVSDPGTFAPGGRQPEVIVFSGSLNTLDQSTAARVLERAWHACSHALVFNFLCDTGRGRSRNPSGGGGVRRFDPLAMLEWATTRTPLVSYRQDYLDGQDGTVVMRVR